MSARPKPLPATAVIVTYQSARTIARTLAAARRCRDEGLLETVIVDNHSSDATREIIARESSWARVVLSERNNGFGRGCNIGFAHVATPYTIFINPDAVVEPPALRAMLEFMEQHPKAGIVGPAIICGSDGIGCLQHTGPCPTPWAMLRDSTPLLRRRSDLVTILPGAAPMRTGWVSGAILMIRTALMRRLNGFDPRFFLYWEETDLCKRAQDSGFEIWALGSALTHHVVGESSRAAGRRMGRVLAKHYYESRYYYMVKHYGWTRSTIVEVAEFVLQASESAVDVVRGRSADRLWPRRQASLLSMPARRSDER
jgi:N-acetylglucosaminyl-diphospho-decaprenol L-rhamnosyltransferase